MILSGRDIQELVGRNILSFKPILSKDQYQQNGVDLILGAAQENSGNKYFTLGVTKEYIKMPDNLMAFVQLRSTWARRGILLPPTVIDAGFCGQITLEIINFCSHPLPIGERFAHIIFSTLSSFADPYRGKYQGQIGVTNAILDKR